MRRSTPPRHATPRPCPAAAVANYCCASGSGSGGAVTMNRIVFVVSPAKVGDPLVVVESAPDFYSIQPGGSKHARLDTARSGAMSTAPRPAGMLRCCHVAMVYREACRQGCTPMRPSISREPSFHFFSVKSGRNHTIPYHSASLRFHDFGHFFLR